MIVGTEATPPADACASMCVAHVEMLRGVLAAPGRSTAADDLLADWRLCNYAAASLACALGGAGLASIAAHPDIAVMLRQLVEHAQTASRAMGGACWPSLASAL